jgi:hypothetical protein
MVAVVGGGVQYNAGFEWIGFGSGVGMLPVEMQIPHFVRDDKISWDDKN